MKQRNNLYRQHLWVCTLLLSLLTTGCKDNNLYDEEYVKTVIEKSFDFKTTYACPIEVSFDRPAYFEIYENSPVENPGQTPFYSAYTNLDGRIGSTMEIPKYLKGKKVYVYTNNLCVRNLSEVTIGENGLVADLKFSALTRGNAVNKGTIVDIPESVVSGIEATLPEDRDNRAKIKLTNTNIDVKEKCFVDLTFIHEFTGGHNKLWYFFYNTKDYNKITSSNMSRYIDFNAGGIVFEDVCYEHGLKSGTTVRLQYKGNDTIPEGVSIGWRIQQPGINNAPYFYSVKTLNPSNQPSHTVVLKDEATQTVIFGFEDWNNPVNSWDVNDILFSVKANPFEAIDNPDIPPLDKPTEVLKSESVWGTLLFEDLYPQEGDYDMNDVVIRYKLTKNFTNSNGGNLLRSMDIEITPYHDGALLTNGFAFMIDDFGYNEITIDGVPTSLDAGGAVTVYPANKEALNRTFKIHLTPKDWNISKDRISWSAFNPFIFVGEREKGIEVHLTKKKPSNIANQNGLGDIVKQYITSKFIPNNLMQWPFAINIPTLDFKVSKEGVRIDKAYPKFEEWVKGYSNNSNFNNQWWNSPDPSLVDN